MLGEAGDCLGCVGLGRAVNLDDYNFAAFTLWEFVESFGLGR